MLTGAMASPGGSNFARAAPNSFVEGNKSSNSNLLWNSSKAGVNVGHTLWRGAIQTRLLPHKAGS